MPRGEKKIILLTNPFSLNSLTQDFGHGKKKEEEEGHGDGTYAWKNNE